MTLRPGLSEAHDANVASRAPARFFGLDHKALRGVNHSPALPSPSSGTRAVLDAPPGKKPLIRLSSQPLNYEAPVSYLHTAVTPNEAFFVRYNLSDIPRIDVRTWRLAIGGAAANEKAELAFEDLKRLPASEVVAVCQCSGNRRRLFQPPAPGIQWGHGAVGCARWKGARLRDVLDLVGLTTDAVEIVFDGADYDRLGKTPDFIKSLPIWKAIEGTTLVAYEMNGQPLPPLNGYPVRIVVPGWTATYWVKHVTSITATTRSFDGYWMKSTYRVPFGRFPMASRFASQESAVDAPITEMMVNSLITSPGDGSVVRAGADVVVAGVAWDGGHGIRAVEVSSDGGRTWVAATLGEDLGPFGFRPWSHCISLAGRGQRLVMARATNAIGQTQPAEPISNPAGYHHNAVHALTLVVA